MTTQRTFRKLHRRLGLIFSIFVFIAAGSGLTHNLMTLTQPPPPKALPSEPLRLQPGMLSPDDAAARLGSPSSDPALITLRSINGELWYQFVYDKETPLYVHSTTGETDPEMDTKYAQQIASHYLGGTSVTPTDFLTSYNREYIPIFRILPVYRLDADDDNGTRVYVSTTTGSVTRHTDNRKQLQANLFSTFHKFAFIPNMKLRSAVLTITTSGMALIAFTGILLFWRIKV